MVATIVLISPGLVDDRMMSLHPLDDPLRLLHPSAHGSPHLDEELALVPDWGKNSLPTSGRTTRRKRA
jgi:hypothetical protein